MRHKTGTRHQATVEKSQTNGNNRHLILILTLLAGPFYLNDFTNIYVRSWQWWLFIDYAGVKFFPMAFTFWLICGKKMRPSAFGLKTQPVLPFLATFLLLSLVGTVMDQNGYPLIAKLPGYPPLGGMPTIANPFWNWVDLTVGLLMVGICEELVFRGFMHTFITRYTENSCAIIVISSIAFGLIHWSLGLHAVLITSTVGAVFMMAYLTTRSLPAIMLAHFVINFIDFSGVIPKSIFKFV